MVPARGYRSERYAGRAKDGRSASVGSPLRFRTALGPLLLYHILIVVGGALTIVAVVRGPPELLVPGVGILAAGIGTVIAVLIWSGRLARRAADEQAHGPSSERRPRWVCVRCANSGVGYPAVCPRCGGWLTRSGPDEVDLPPSRVVP